MCNILSKQYTVCLGIVWVILINPKLHYYFIWYGSESWTKLYMNYMSPSLAAYPAHYYLLVLMTLSVLGDMYKYKVPYWREFWISLSSSVLYPYLLLWTPLLHMCNILSSLKSKRPYVTVTWVLLFCMYLGGPDGLRLRHWTIIQRGLCLIPGWMCVHIFLVMHTCFC